MKTRAPGIVVSGLIIIIFVLMFYYMTCESKVMELERTSKQFEEKIRTLTITNMGLEEIIQAILVNKRMIDDDNEKMQKQIKKLKEKVQNTLEELEKVISEKNIVEEKLSKLKSLSEKILAMRKAHKGFKSSDHQLNGFKKQLSYLEQQVESYKQQLSVFQGNLIDQPSLKLSTTTPVLSVIYSDVIDEELDDSDEPENLFKSLNDLLYNNGTDLSGDETQMITTTTTRTTVLPLNETNAVIDEHMHVKDYELVTDDNKIV